MKILNKEQYTVASYIISEGYNNIVETLYAIDNGFDFTPHDVWESYNRFSDIELLEVIQYVSGLAIESELEIRAKVENIIREADENEKW